MLRSGDPVSLTSNPRVSLPGTLPRLLNALSASNRRGSRRRFHPGAGRSQPLIAGATEASPAALARARTTMLANRRCTRGLRFTEQCQTDAATEFWHRHEPLAILSAASSRTGASSPFRATGSPAASSSGCTSAATSSAGRSHPSATCSLAGRPPRLRGCSLRWIKWSDLLRRVF
jgi:hypothetical protein